MGPAGNGHEAAMWEAIVVTTWLIFNVLMIFRTTIKRKD